MVIFNVAPGGRDNYKIWEEKQVPSVIFEITSAMTKDRDTGYKKTLYEQLGVKEYWLFDPKGEWIENKLKGFRLERDEYEDIVTDTETRRSINFINVRKVKVKEDAKKHIYDFENFSYSYSFSEVRQTNFNLQRFLRENQSGSIAYNYSPTNEPWEPDRKSTRLNSSHPSRSRMPSSA